MSTTEADALRRYALIHRHSYISKYNVLHPECADIQLYRHTRLYISRRKVRYLNFFA